MTLQCPHCGEPGTHMHRDVLGHFVVCPVCQQHFEWEKTPPFETEAVWCEDEEDQASLEEGE
jgi:transcription elongation factor Elf1